MDDNVPLLLIILLIIIVFASLAVLLRICMSQHDKKKPRVTNQQSQVASATSARNNQVRLPSAATDLTQSDHQIIFERMRQPEHLRNVLRLSSTTPATQIVHEMAEQFRFDRMQMEYERRAQERRDVSDRLNSFVHMPPRLDATNEVTVDGVTNNRLTEVASNPVIESRETTFGNDVSYSTPAPRYISEDDELPSYEAAVATSNIVR